MSQENVEVVRRVQEAFEAGVEARDFGAAWDTGAVTDDSELVPAPEVPGEAGQATYRGREEFAEFMRRWTEDLEHWSARTERLIDAPGDRVVAFMKSRAFTPSNCPTTTSTFSCDIARSVSRLLEHGVFAQRSGTVSGERAPKNVALGTFPGAAASISTRRVAGSIKVRPAPASPPRRAPSAPGRGSGSSPS
jgi:hypothetical protein